MIEGAKWKKWLWFYLPMGMFILGLLFPFYWMLVTTLKPDGELYRPWNHPLYSPFWTSAPTLDHVKNLLYETLFGTWMWNTMLIALVATLISLFCGVIAGYALARLRFRWAGLLGTAIFVTYLVPQTLLFIPLAEIIRDYRIGDTPWALILTYPTFLIPFCTWLMMGYFKTIPKELEECARIDGATRWQAMLYIRHSVGRHLRLHPVVERVHLRAGVSVLAGAENGAGGRNLRAHPRRRVFLGLAHGRRAPRLDSGCIRLLVLRRALCRRHDRQRERLNG
jgi:ABC-type spermidine/putrescine transport system permease subunit II